MAVSNTAVTVGSVTTAILASVSATLRRHAVLTNDSVQVMYLALGASAVLNQGIRLAPGEKFIVSPGDNYSQAINAICASGSANMCVFEETI